ncbi:MAG: 4-hydroxybutyrate CoA-transferase [Halieaceae bacterium]|uniref:acetyl-CoA hydrolase/transferase family protein n=1 Tax=Haliea alexandrii TaxID=2448162 RepID=UPI000F0B6ED1|nr:acetyl-CoA hydrolase/transferase C-terminal domain-containing protein [Haliea alexandrii]MCR9184202.1 4-hydroxybutyrate CoA-transferase [Halieaceae bacterium]
MPSTVEIDTVRQLIKPGYRVFVQAGIGEPRDLITALSGGPDHPGQTDDAAVEYLTVSIPGINAALAPLTMHRGAHLCSTFMHAGLDAGATHRPIRFLPLHYRDTSRFLEAGERFDVAVIQVAPPDTEGFCSLGISVDFVPAILDKCDCIIAEVNSQMPAPVSSPRIPLSAIHYRVDVDHPLPCSEPAVPGATELAIARNVADLIDDGSCIQIGIGKLPGCILKHLAGHRRLGLHSGLLSDGVRELIEADVVTGECKSVDRGRHVTGMAWGSSAFYDWIQRHPDIVFQPVDYTHDLRILASIDQFISINSVLEVDLYGQANAETINGRQVSASGGLVDFARGARASRGGKSIIALPATAMRGRKSRIVAGLSSPITTLCRADVDYVVTEYGHAALFGQCTEARAQLLVDIAAPDYRDELWHAWENR